MNKVLLAFLLIGSIKTVDAAPVRWILGYVFFDDGGHAFGTFVYDADTNLYSDIRITTTPGDFFVGSIYRFHNPDTGSRAIGPLLVSEPDPVLFTPAFNLNLEAALTNNGGTIRISTDAPPSAFEGACVPIPLCTGFARLRGVSSGFVTAAVPVPPAALLMFSAIVVLRRFPRRLSEK